ncbi:hypothetical protein Pyn_19427 [Prunus yedoensis var. nudiflora]|uniref:Uncharacterized protein n=1 Tax=Prunus yedoensis var. nudiflora TaxID=2094558 RepID=A0A314Y0M2_PRUYE|nr:hypothetical protein Pyn_19427 [Prunus yedoensis var. nudiflora]
MADEPAVEKDEANEGATNKVEANIVEQWSVRHEPKRNEVDETRAEEDVNKGESIVEVSR